MTSTVLDVANLSVGYGEDTVTLVVLGVSFQLREREILGLAGESGSGKSTSALAALGYRAPKSTIASGRSELDGQDLLQMSMHTLHDLWGRQIAYVAQSAGTTLNPALTIATQMSLPLVAHLGLSDVAARQRCRELLRDVHLEDEGLLDRYPHQFSGGQQQRIALALALSCDPKVLILDEPTTGLDVTTQAQISALVRQLVDERSIAALYVSHDLSLLGGLTDRICVMYGGQVVESGPSRDVLNDPRHPYTKALLAAVPRIDLRRRVTGIPGEPPEEVVQTACGYAPRCAYAIQACTEGPIELTVAGPTRVARCIRHTELPVGEGTPDRDNGMWTNSDPDQNSILAVEGLRCAHRQRKETLMVVKDFSLQLRAGETVGIVGESGSGKTTILRAIAGLHEGPMDGSLAFRGKPLARLAGARSRDQRRALQIVFQDPGSSLNPRHTIGRILTRAVRILGEGISRGDEPDHARALLRQVKLPERFFHRYPWELSGGQQQRVAIARAFVGRPSVLLCDEVTSALDVSVQATIIDLLKELTTEYGTAVLFVSHDLAVVRSVASRIIVMRNGEVCEDGSTEDLISRPSHPYTRQLLSAVPRIEPASRHEAS